MNQTIVIDPVTRIEGHSKITIQLDDRGEVADAHFHVTQFRGFERITQGRPVHEMPAIMARICGICPVSHLIASAKAVDDILAVEPTPTGADLRRIINLGQIVQSNALSFFHLSAPDLLFGFDADPGGAQHHRHGRARTRGWRRTASRSASGASRSSSGSAASASTPTGSCPAAWPRRSRRRSATGSWPACRRPSRPLERAIAWYKSDMLRWEEEAATFGNFRSAFMGLVDRDGQRGPLRRLAAGRRRRRQVPRRPARPQARSTTTSARPWSRGRTSSRPTGSRWATRTASTASDPWRGSTWRTGWARRAPTRSSRSSAGASAAWPARPSTTTTPASSTRCTASRGSRSCCAARTSSSTHVRSRADINRHEGIGVSEAPRGTLMHHYRVDDDGIVQWANLVIATGHNNMAMNRAVLQVARLHVKANALTEPMLNRVEAVIRCYDPCLSCSTHALGQMALQHPAPRPGRNGPGRARPVRAGDAGAPGAGARDAGTPVPARMRTSPACSSWATATRSAVMTRSAGMPSRAWPRTPGSTALGSAGSTS